MNTDSTEESPQPVLAYAVPQAMPVAVVLCRLLAIVMAGMGIERFLEFFGILAFQQPFLPSTRNFFGPAVFVFAFCLVWPLLA
jgi:hypothetical protein